MTKKQAESFRHWLDSMERLAIDYDTAHTLRRIAMTLHRWHEKECGDGYGCIERDETTGKAYWLNSMTGRRYAIADRETGAKKRLAKIASGFPALWFYVQGDPRGCALYVGRKADLKPGDELDAVYYRGVACDY